MVGEWLLASGWVKSLEQYYTPEVAKETAKKDGHWGRRLVASVARPFYQPQDSINRYAELYSHLAELLDAPLERYGEARAAADEFATRTAEDAWPPSVSPRPSEVCTCFTTDTMPPPRNRTG